MMLKPTILVLFVATCTSIAGSAPTTAPATAPAATLPPAVQQFKAKVAKLGAKEILAAATAEFGMSTRDVGSGVRIPQWDVAGGILTVHPHAGPTYRAGGRTVWLLPTRNPAEENLLRGFEMTTLPQGKFGNRFWIGNVQIADDKTYHFVDSGSNRNDRGDQSRNFFMAHPTGRVRIAWPAGITAETALEELSDRVVATLTFVAADGTEFACDVTSSVSDRRLSIAGPSFAAEASWRHSWPANGGKPNDR